jgi:putative transposase
MIEAKHPKLSIVAQCRLVEISKTGLYYKPASETALNLELMTTIDKQFMETSW